MRLSTFELRRRVYINVILRYDLLAVLMSFAFIFLYSNSGRGLCIAFSNTALSASIRDGGGGVGQQPVFCRSEMVSRTLEDHTEDLGVGKKYLYRFCRFSGW